MFLLARRIKSMGVKMVLSGEGADESLAGYLYFHQAPNGSGCADRRSFGLKIRRRRQPGER